METLNFSYILVKLDKNSFILFRIPNILLCFAIYNILFIPKKLINLLYFYFDFVLMYGQHNEIRVKDIYKKYISQSRIKLGRYIFCLMMIVNLWRFRLYFVLFIWSCRWLMSKCIILFMSIYETRLTDWGLNEIIFSYFLCLHSTSRNFTDAIDFL